MPVLPTALDPGFKFADPYAVGLLFLGLALFVALGALSHQEERAFSAAIFYLGLGVLASVGQFLFGLPTFDPVEHAEVLERLSELALIVAVFASGLSLERALTRRSVGSVALLLGLVMPLTIAVVAVFGSQVMGLSVGAAVLLGAILAPTDPVLAGDVGLGPPGGDVQGEPRYSLSAEAGINDGLASPFVLLGILIASREGTDWLADWVLVDVLYAVTVGVVLGAAGGYGIAALMLRLREQGFLAPKLDGFVAVATVLLVYGLTETVGAYGLLAAFAAGFAFRRYEFEQEYHGRVHAGAEAVSTFLELAVLLFLGSVVTLAGLAQPGVAGWLLAFVLILLVRPLAVLALVGQGFMSLQQRLFLAWFGVRGVAAPFYVAVVIEAEVLQPPEEVVLFWTVAVCVMVSIVLHGVSATTLTRRLLS